MITGREISERFIRAVQIMEGLYHVGPAGGGASWIAVPYTQADKNGWGSERLAAEREAFWNSINNAPRPWEVTEAEQTIGWLSIVSDEQERLALTSWARCMAKGGIFKDWCKKVGIHPETGRRRKERAIVRILLSFTRNPLQHNENSINEMLPDTPVLGDNCVNIGEEGQRVWRADDAVPLHFDESLRDFSWAVAQNERRRQREAKRKAAA